ncbi:MAG: nucleotide kinase domain-containing protein [Myxococcota bacterium]
MSTPHNPYATALDGLELDDPVTAFFDFCRARERVRVRRESGAPAPWSDDPIFQRGRFLNVFREDDRGSRAIRRFASPLTEDLPRLVHAVFFARWCNRQQTLDALSAELLAHPDELVEALRSLDEPPWCNETAYPVEPITWAGESCSRFETATRMLGEVTPFLVEAICGAEGNVTRATQRVNAGFGMDNDFPIFMAVMDLAWFRPEIIHPSSPVPTGIGAVAFLDRLQAHLGLSGHTETCDAMIALQAVHWPEARRPFQPIDIEYLSCECRKYFSYVNGTKAFEGKNLFRPVARAATSVRADGGS